MQSDRPRKVNRLTSEALIELTNGTKAASDSEKTQHYHCNHLVMPEHKNRTRAPLKPLNAASLALSVGGLGFLRPAPGTWGSMPPPLLAGLMLLAGSSISTITWTIAGVFVVSCALCVVLGNYGEQRFGRKDAAEVVVDETAGVCPPVIAALVFGGSDHFTLIGLLAAAFIAFRALDIFKPWPANRLEDLPHGWGVLMDDVAAGIYAAMPVSLLAFMIG